MDWNTYNWTELELETSQTRALVPVEEVKEGEFRGAPEDSAFEGQYMGGGWGEPGWIPPESGPEEEPYESSGYFGPPPSPVAGTSDSSIRGAREALKDQLRKEEEYRKRVLKVEEEELKAREREYKRKYKTSPGQAIGKAWKTAKEVAGPKVPIKGLYIPKAMPGLYVPKVPAWRPTTEFMPAGEAHRPHLGLLKRAGSPGPSTKIKAPFRDVLKFEGLGSALSRLRLLEKFPEVDKAVYAEIQANGDIDTPSHVKSKVKQLGFTTKEIDVSLKRLRDVGLVVPTGSKVKGEKELMVV